MRKLRMWNVITLDGYFQGDKDWDLSFHETIWGPELEKLSLEQLHSSDYLVFGRVTYEGMAAYWKEEKGEIAELMNSIPKLVFSRTLKSVDWNNSILVHGNASEEIARFKQEGDGDMYLFGSANLAETFMNDNLFDEMRIGIAPVILGNGKHLFRNQAVSFQKLDLISAQPLSNGGVVVTYKATTTPGIV